LGSTGPFAIWLLVDWLLVNGLRVWDGLWSPLRYCQRHLIVSQAVVQLVTGIGHVIDLGLY
jgi:hypothetical protein